ncbi:GNAT family N-acetyltransferase [Aquibacillus koreensis]|uniref:GNAT family N-acetyltransferase n=1 Tax=Aquibacillus koreensis TaxID=279446 RepID=A0A9X3WM35_9BACI|nr:GNAT family N-acetyltransferase [Aquibacillus koreensis]MCT2536344.1 GNAT family N-acetyltransferase [Aquibacillus koreensis]MDC3421305.1 GNAT family N-acetyltransferase [Aquibacillus koreensis]
MEIRLLRKEEKPPMDLLLLADPSIDHVEAYLKKGYCFLVKQDTQVIGVYVLLPSTLETVELKNVAVSEEHQGRGIGKLLVMDAMKKAKEKGFKKIEVGTGNSSIGQLALYQKCGFRITGITRDFFIDHYQEKIMENGIQCKDMIRLCQEL